MTTVGQLATARLSAGSFGNAEELIENARRFDAGFERLLARIAGCHFESAARKSLAGLVFFAGSLGEALKLITAGRQDDLVNLLHAVRGELDGAGDGSHHGEPGDWRFLVPGADTLTTVVIERAGRSIHDDQDGENACAFTVEVPQEPDFETIREAREILTRTLPGLAAGTLGMVNGVAVLRGDVESAFFWTTPGLIYINRSTLSDPLVAADSLLHECTHQKMLFIRLMRRVLRPGYDDWGGLSVPIPWGARGFRRFTTGRAIAAAHVYLHLAAFQLRLLEEAGDVEWPPRSQVERRLAQRASRSTYLLEALSSPYYRAELGADGDEFLGWMAAINETLLSAPMGRGSLADLSSSVADV